MTNQTRSIDYRAPEQEWQSLFEWIETNTRLLLKSNGTNPWFKKPLTEEEQRNYVHTVGDSLFQVDDDQNADLLGFYAYIHGA